MMVQSARQPDPPRRLRTGRRVCRGRYASADWAGGKSAETGSIGQPLVAVGMGPLILSGARYAAIAPVVICAAVRGIEPLLVLLATGSGEHRAGGTVRD